MSRSGEIDSGSETGLFAGNGIPGSGSGRSDGRVVDPVTVLERVLVRDRLARLTPLAMLELLATERTDRGRSGTDMLIAGDIEEDMLKAA